MKLRYLCYETYKRGSFLRPFGHYESSEPVLQFFDEKTKQWEDVITDYKYIEMKKKG